MRSRECCDLCHSMRRKMKAMRALSWVTGVLVGMVALSPACGTGSVVGSGRPTDGGVNPDGRPPSIMGQMVVATIVPSAGVSGMTRVSFGLPMARGWLTDVRHLSVEGPGGAAIAAGFSALASHPDGSNRSVLVQLDMGLSGEASITVKVHEAPVSGPSVSLVPVETTLDAGGLPRAWVVLPAD